MNELKSVSTKDLVEELIKREGVKEVVVKPYEDISLEVEYEKYDLPIEGGPARILVVFD